MAAFSPIPWLLFLLLAAAASAAPSADDLVAELQTLRSQSPSGVIHLDDRSLTRFLSSAPSPRPYSLLVFFDAAQFRNKPDLNLPRLHSEFSLLSSSFSSYHSAAASAEENRLFFCDIEFGESQASFHLFGINSLPHIRLFPAAARSINDDSLAMDQSAFGRGADSMAEFVEAKAKIRVGPILHPPPVSTKQIIALIAILVVSAPFLIRRVLAGGTLLNDPRLWMAFALFVYFFSVSGVMFNIIRKIAMVLPDRNNPGKLVFFYQGSGMQLGAEGFAVGSLYTMVGLILAFITHGLVRVRKVATQRGFMLAGMMVAYWAVHKVIYLDNWKTGYSIHAFWPNSWR